MTPMFFILMVALTVSMAHCDALEVCNAETLDLCTTSTDTRVELEADEDVIAFSLLQTKQYLSADAVPVSAKQDPTDEATSRPQLGRRYADLEQQVERVEDTGSIRYSGRMGLMDNMTMVKKFGHSYNYSEAMGQQESLLDFVQPRAAPGPDMPTNSVCLSSPPSPYSVKCGVFCGGLVAFLALVAKWVAHADATRVKAPETKSSENGSGIGPDLAPQPKSDKQHSSVYDNAKFFLMVCIIMSHYQMDTDTGWYTSSKMLWPWMFNLPIAGFSFISGSLSKGPPSFRKLYSLVTTVLLPFCLYTVLDELIESSFRRHQPYSASSVFHSLLNASPGVSWYLQSLIAWRLFVWFCHQAAAVSGLPRWIWLTCLSATAFVASSFTPVRFWSLGNGIAFAPCFVTGVVFPLEELLAAVPMNMLTVLAAVVSGVVWTLAFPRVSLLPAKNLYDSLLSLHGDRPCISALSWCEGMLTSLLFVTVFLVFLTTACPRGSHWFTECGKGSIYIYLLHKYALQLMYWPTVAQIQQALHIFSNVASSSVVGTALMITVSFMIAVMLSSKPVKWIFAPIIEPMSLLP